MERKEFEELAKKAFDQLPEVFKKKLENIDLTIEEEPDMEIVKALGLGVRGPSSHKYSTLLNTRLPTILVYLTNG